LLNEEDIFFLNFWQNTTSQTEAYTTGSSSFTISFYYCNIVWKIPPPHSLHSKVVKITLVDSPLVWLPHSVTPECWCLASFSEVSPGQLMSKWSRQNTFLDWCLTGKKSIIKYKQCTLFVKRLGQITRTQNWNERLGTLGLQQHWQNHQGHYKKYTNNVKNTDYETSTTEDRTEMCNTVKYYKETVLWVKNMQRSGSMKNCHNPEVWRGELSIYLTWQPSGILHSVVL
jgi:hypothetical protein